MANILRKFSTLLWKSYIVRRCHWIVTLLELCIPLLLFIGLAILNSNVVTLSMLEDEHTFKPKSEEAVLESLREGIEEKYFLFTPVNNATVKFMHLLKTDFMKDMTDNVRGMRKESDIEHFFKEIHQNKSNSEVLGIVFLQDMTQQPLKTFSYKIRSTKSPYSHASTNLFVGIFDATTPDMYEKNGFLALQLMLNRCFMKFIGSEIKSTFSVEKFPLPAMKDNKGREVIHTLLPLATALSFIFLCPGLLKRVVEEKQTGVKELMKLMGLPSLLLWFSWFFHAMSIAIISITAITVIVGIPFKSNEPVLLCCGSVIWVSLLLYCTASVSFLFAVSAFFKKPTLSMVLGLIVWLGSAVATKFVIGAHISYYCKLLTSLLPNIAMAWGFQSIFIYEDRDLSMSFGDAVNPSVAMGNDFQLWQVWLLFVVQTVLYFVVALYFEAVFPGDYGVAKPWHFPGTACFNWMKVAPQCDVKGDLCRGGDAYEPLAETLPVGIKIRKLRKVFKSPWNKVTRIAVDDVSLDICKEQITALLGHNGAGKSTTMMILTGMLSPTSGTVEINGYNIKYNMNKVRESLGLCPQHNLLFPDLTVQQHLIFFAKLKGGSDQDPDAEASMYAKKLNLIPHLNKTPHELSGGYKRRLCLALAFIGRSKTIILDEPTSGLDPEARREIWDLLLSMRGSRTILITTHIMEEADVLGDRIAIMDHGQVQCYGTPMYLKKLYGTGYVLSILKKNTSDPERIETAVKCVIPGAELKSCVASLMTFCLPEGKRSLFPELFAKLQDERLLLGIDCVGVSITTLEEVFLRVGEIALEESGKNEDTESVASEKSESCLDSLSSPNVKGLQLYLQQGEALIKKRILVMSIGYLIQFILVVMTVMLVTFLALQTFGGKPVPPLRLDLSLYGKTNVLYSSTNETPEKFVTSYTKNVKKTGSSSELVSPEIDIISELLKKGYADREAYIFDYIVAAKLNETDRELVALYSDMALHSLPISMNLLANSLIKYETNDEEYEISVTNHPFQLEEPEYLDGELVALLWMALVPLALTFWVGLFVILPMEERVSSSRQLQSMAGVSVPMYWFTLYVCDLMLHLVLCGVLIVTIAVTDTQNIFDDRSVLFALFCIFLLYGVSSVPFAYFASFWKDTWAGCYAILVMVNIVAGLILTIIMEILHSFKIQGADSVQGIIRLVPNFSLTQILQQFISQVMNNKMCLRVSKSQLDHHCSVGYGTYAKCCSCIEEACPAISDKSTSHYFSENQTLLLYLGLSSILYASLVIVLDMGVFEWLWEKLLSLRTSESSEPTGNDDVDDDVDGEAKCVEEIFRRDTAMADGADLLVNNLKKKYGIISKTMAVKGVSFQVKPGECFGLLGVNGAGKTTTFKMLTGAVVPTRGVASIAGYRSDKHKSQYLSQIGYCPQHDALIEGLTANETLRLYGTLRGVPRNRLNREVQRWINLLGLREYRNKYCGTYSGGNKRKLMTAMALIGGPPLVFLDEPTSGVDPVARRNLWNSLMILQKAGQSIVLTSHSMEECEALCNRLGIMVDGQLMCMGNIPYLKNKYKQGSTIKMKLVAGCEEETVQNLKLEMESTFSKLTLKDAHETLLHYVVTDPNVSWGYMFKKMEMLKENCEIVEDYIISETSLEEVFLSFAQS